MGEQNDTRVSPFKAIIEEVEGFNSFIEKMLSISGYLDSKDYIECFEDLAALALDPNLRDQSFELPDGWWKLFVTSYKSGIKQRLTNQVQTRHVIAKHKEDMLSS